MLRDNVLRHRSQSALGRFVRPADIADTLLFLCPPAGENITGAALEVTAGAIL